VQIGYFAKDAIPVNGRFRNCFSCLSVTLFLSSSIVNLVGAHTR
jgi:hypothetical protein